MWPYGKKTTFPTNRPTLEVGGAGGGKRGFYYPSKASCLDMEYFKRLTMSVSLGIETFPDHRIDTDGRVIRHHGVNHVDVTDQYVNRKYSRTQQTRTQPARHLHNRNVSQLKVVLNLPDQQRHESLAKITGPIVRNEVAPPIAQLQQDEFLSDHLRKQTNNLRLPPLQRRVLFDRARRIEHITNSVSSEKDSMVSGVMYDPAGSEDEDYLPYIGRRESVMTSDHFSDLPDPHPNWASGVHKRRKSFSQRYRAKLHPDDDKNAQTKYEQNLAKAFKGQRRDSFGSGFKARKDSVGRLTESIRDQFRAAIQANGEKGEPPLMLVNQPVDSLHKSMPQDGGNRNSKGDYKLRHEYGKNLERNWFMDQYMKRQRQTGDNGTQAPGYDLRLDIFYSPEPKSDDEIEGSDVNDDVIDAEDDSSMQCGAFSTMTAKRRARAKRNSRPSLQNQTSLDTHLEEHESDVTDNGETSESDIEIILKDNQLIQRKTKHKLRKKRQRQIERYKAFLPHEMQSPLDPTKQPNIAVPLTDQEIRALRLNLKHKEKLKSIRGLRKFKQIVNAVRIYVAFRRILTNIRKKKKMLIKSREKKIAQMVAKRLKAQQKQLENAEESDREQTPRPNMKDRFFAEIGSKIIFDVARLNIHSDSEESEVESETQPENDSSHQNEIQQKRQEKEDPARKQQNTKPSKFAKELKKVSLSDLCSMDKPRKMRKRRRHRQRRRRHSIPVNVKPTTFLVEVPEKTRRRRDRSNASKPKEVKRFRSPPAPKCSCHRSRSSVDALRATPQPLKCAHQPEVKKKKTRTMEIETAGLMRTYSLGNLANRKPIELEELLRGIDIPAKEIKLQILARKFRRQRQKKKLIRLSPVQMPDRPIYEPEARSDDQGSVSAESDESDDNDYDFVYGGPFVGSGVMWNSTSRDRKPSWTEADVDREVKRITRIFHEMKECRYLRLDGFNDAIMARLNSLSRASPHKGEK